MAQTLANVTITKQQDETFLLHLEDDEGNMLEFEATYEQLDVIAESIEEHLNEDLEDPDLVDDDDPAEEV